MPAADDILERLLRDLRRLCEARGPRTYPLDEAVLTEVAAAELAFSKVRLGIVRDERPRDERPVPWFVDHLLDDEGEGR